MDSTILTLLSIYHQHEVVGMEKIPQDGRALVVVNHSLASYDILLLFRAIFLQRQRRVRPLADHMFFKLKWLNDFVTGVGGVQGKPDEAEKLIQDEELVAVAPGGMREALRPSRERYKLLWERRKGFVRLAIRTQTPIYLALCPRADDILDVYENQLTKWAYKSMRLPIFFARGVGPTFIPRPVKLTHRIDDPIIPPRPATDPKAFDKQVVKLHKQIMMKAQADMYAS